MFRALVIVSLTVLLTGSVTANDDYELAGTARPAGDVSAWAPGDLFRPPRQEAWEIRNDGRRVPEDCLRDCCGDSCGTEPIRFRVGAPAWLPEVHGQTVIRGRNAPVNVTTRDLFRAVDDVDFVIGGRIEADAGRWGVIADGLFIKLSGSKGLAGDRVNVAAGFQQAIAEAAVTCDIQDELFGNGTPPGFNTELLAGARYWSIGSNGVTVTGPRGGSVTTSGTRDWVDPIVGGRMAIPLTDDLLFRLRADVGGFGAASQFTWNVEAVGEYRCSNHCGIQMGYRVLDVDYRSGSGRNQFVYDVQYRGPIATLVFDF